MSPFSRREVRRLIARRGRVRKVSAPARVVPRDGLEMRRIVAPSRGIGQAATRTPTWLSALRGSSVSFNRSLANCTNCIRN